MLDSRLPPCNAILEARSPLSNTSSGAGALPLEVRIEYDSDRKFSKSKFFHSFLKNHLSPRFMLPCYCKPKIYLRFFEVCTYPSIQNFGLEAPPCNAISEGSPPPPCQNLLSLSGNHFSIYFMQSCLFELEIFFRFFEVCTLLKISDIIIM